MKKIIPHTLLCALLSACAFENTDSSGAAPRGLMTNLLTHPHLSVITEAPRFSWIAPEMLDGEPQAAYRILLEDAKGALLWDSGRVEGAQSLHAEYSGPALSEEADYSWRVQVWNAQGKASALSERQRFKVGKIDPKKAHSGKTVWVELEGGGGEKFWGFENRHPISRHAVEPAVVIEKNADGELFLDFEKSAFSGLKLALNYAPKTEGEKAVIKVKLGELAKGGRINPKPGAGVIYQEFELELEAGEREYSVQMPRFVPKYPHSIPMPEHIGEVLPFRYCQVDFGGLDVQFKSAKQTRLYTLFDDSASAFESSDDILNQVWELCKYSVKINTFNGDYASSQRERMMYESDTYIHQLGHYCADREFSVARYSMENMIFHATWPTEWIPHSIIMAWTDYMYTGDPTSLRMHYEDLKPKALCALLQENGLVSTRAKPLSREFFDSIHYSGNKFKDIVDWPHGNMSPARPKGGETDEFEFTDYNSVVNAFHYRALVLMGEIATALGKEADAAQYAKRAAQFKKVFNKSFFDAKRGVYLDGIGSGHSAIHSNLFALAFGLVEKKNQKSVIDYIKKRGMACGVYAANYLLEGLYDCDEADYALSLLTSKSDRSWYNMIRVGSTVTTEAWDNKYKVNNGWTHGWSSSPAHIVMRKIMGVEPAAAGFGEILISPRPGKLEWAKAKVPTIRGPVGVEFENGGGEFLLRVSLPQNLSAKVRLPDGRGGWVYEEARPGFNSFSAKANP